MKRRKAGRYGDWVLKRSKVVYDNPWVCVEHDEVLNPNNHPGIYGRIHFKNVAIGVIPMDEQKNIWLVGQYRYPLRTYSWEIPEGGGKVGTSALGNAKRELREETGLRARRWKKILEMDLSNSVTDERGVIFLATGLSQGEAEPEDDEALRVRKVPFEKAYREVVTGKIRDSLSVAGILRLKIWLENGGR